MNQKHLARLAAFLLGAMGVGAHGDHHVGSPPGGSYVACSAFPIRCQVECNALNECRGRLGSESLLCDIEKQRLDLCVYNPPPPPPPPACPAGQHLNDEGVCEEESGCPEGQHTGEDGECQDDYECGEDAIGGGETPCEPCGKGKVPNHNETACISCPHGESGQFPGRCDPACWHTATDTVAKAALLGVPAEAKERGASVYCLRETVHIASWTMSTSDNACQVTYANEYAGPSCWSGGSKTNGCNLARAHTHPFFSYPRDREVTCHDNKIDSKRRAKNYNLSGRNFSPADTQNARDADVLGHLGLPPDEPDEGAPIPTKRDTVKALRRSGAVVEI